MTFKQQKSWRKEGETEAGGRKGSGGRRPLSRQCPQGLGKLWFLTPHPAEKLPTQEISQLHRGFLQVGAMLPRDESSYPSWKEGIQLQGYGFENESPTLQTTHSNRKGKLGFHTDTLNCLNAEFFLSCCSLFLSGMVPTPPVPPTT